VVARLSKEIEAFDASLAPAAPVRVSALVDDHTGWEKLWRGVAIAAVVAFGAVVLLLFVGFRTVRRLRRR
jgi:hypothetical protein